MANEAADVGARVAKFLAEGAALPHYDNIPEQRNTLSAIPLIRRVRGFQAIVASLSPVEQKGALKLSAERLEILTRRSTMLQRIVGQTSQPIALRDLEDALAHNTAQLRKLVHGDEQLLVHILNSLERPEIAEQVRQGLPQEEDIRASPPRGTDAEVAARVWRRRIARVPPGHPAPHPQGAGYIKHDSPTRTGQVDLRNKLAKAEANPVDSLSYYQQQQAKLGKSRRGSTSIAGAWESLWQQTEEAGQAPAAPQASDAAVQLQNLLGQHLDRASSPAPAPAPTQSSSLAPSDVAEEVMQRLRASIAAATGKTAAASTPANSEPELHSARDHVGSNATPLPAPPPPAPAAHPQPVQVQQGVQGMTDHALFTERPTPRPYDAADGSASVRSTASRMISRQGHSGTSAGILSLPRDTLSARRAAASGNLGPLAQVFTALPRKTQIAARELALDVCQLQGKLAVIHTRLEAASAQGGGQGQGRPEILKVTEDALAARLAKLMRVGGEHLAAMLLTELQRDAEGVRAALAIPEPDEQAEDVDGEKTGIGGDAKGLWLRRLGLHDTATVRKESEPSSLVFSSLPADGILPDGSRDLWQLTGSHKEAARKAKEVQNVSYYQRQQQKYGKGRRGSTSVANAWAEVFGSAEQQQQQQQEQQAAPEKGGAMEAEDVQGHQAFGAARSPNSVLGATRSTLPSTAHKAYAPNTVSPGQVAAGDAQAQGVGMGYGDAGMSMGLGPSLDTAATRSSPQPLRSTSAGRVTRAEVVPTMPAASLPVGVARGVAGEKVASSARVASAAAQAARAAVEQLQAQMNGFSTRLQAASGQPAGPGYSGRGAGSTPVSAPQGGGMARYDQGLGTPASATGAKTYDVSALLSRSRSPLRTLGMQQQQQASVSPDSAVRGQWQQHIRGAASAAPTPARGQAPSIDVDGMMASAEAMLAELQTQR